MQTGVSTRARTCALRALLPFLLLAFWAAPASATDYSVRLYEEGFWPPTLTVNSGDTIHFDNVTDANWSVTSGKGLFDSGSLPIAGAYTMQLSVPGVHAFHSTGPGGGEGTIIVRGTKLGGSATDEAVDRIPDVPFPTPSADSVGTHPTLAVEASRTRIMLGFEEGATVAQVNSALADADVTIIGGRPDLGMLLVETRLGGYFGSFTMLDQALAILRAAPGIQYAAMSTKVSATAVPRKADSVTEGIEPGWDWDEPQTHGNWGVAGAAFPEAWNLLESVKRKRPSVITGIVDVGFEDHDDLTNLHIQHTLCPSGGGDCQALGNVPDVHGNHVAGIIGADYDNDAEEAKRSLGVSGANPVAKMYGYSSKGFSGSWSENADIEGATTTDKQIELLDLVIRSKPAELRVINHSMTGVRFDKATWFSKYGSSFCGPGERDDDLPNATQRCSPENLDEWQREIANLGMAASSVLRLAASRNVLIVQAAGNAGYSFCGTQMCPGSYDPNAALPVSAASNTEIGWAARNWDDNILVGQGLPNPVLTVQAANRTGAPRFDSALEADVVAPGDEILSTGLDDGYVKLGGTSMAAPQVTALAGLLLADNPSLSAADVRRRILDWADGRPTSGQPLDFTWTMADRMNRDANGDKLVDYAPIGHSLTPEKFAVDLDACDAGVDNKAIGTYTWSVDGTVVGSTADCRFRWRAPGEGTYTVTLDAQGSGGAEGTISKQVKVDDIVIVSVGDSIASGEGVPDIPDPTGPGRASWQYERCHRSAFSGTAQAARRLERRDAKSSVTFLHLACSGARMRGDVDLQGNIQPGEWGSGGLLTGYEGVTEHAVTSACAQQGRTNYEICEPPQLETAKALLGSREPDALLISIGANDMRFSTILMDCMLGSESCTTSQEGRDLFNTRIALLEARYAEVAQKIESLWPDMDHDRVIITQYPDPTTDETGAVDMSCGIASGVSYEEAMWAHETVVPALNQKVAQAAAQHGWTLATGIPEQFTGHGYCSSDSWVVDVSGSFWDQFNQDGGFHPKYVGHNVYANSILAALNQIDLVPAESERPAPRDRAPRLDAFRPLAAGTTAARFADANDPSTDGNRRIARTATSEGTVTETPDEKSGITDEEKTAADGRVDMRDLRRYRDAWLQYCASTAVAPCPAPADIDLDGSIGHAKRDLNFDRCVFNQTPEGCGAREARSSRFDFNGDQKLGIDEKSLVPWTDDGAPVASRAAGRSMTDLEVLTAGWTGGEGAEGWTKDKLRSLMESADIEVQAEAVLDSGASKADLQIRKKGGADVGPKRTIRRRNGSVVMTVPLDASGEEYELVATATSASGTMQSTSAPFALKYGQDELVAVCPDVSMKAMPKGIPADGQSESVITATVNKCGGREVAGHDVTFTLDSSEGGASLVELTPTTNANGVAQVRFKAGTTQREYTIHASVDMGEGGEPLEGEVVVETVPTIQVKYVWKQVIEQWDENGSTRWGGAFDPFKPDCTMPAFEYCIDSFHVGLWDPQGTNGVQRAGTLTGGGDLFELDEEVSNHAAKSRSEWALSFPDDEPENGAKQVGWQVLNPTEYTDHEVTGVTSEDTPDGIRLNGIQAIGDLPYTYQLALEAFSGTIDPIEGHAASSQYFLIPQGGDRHIRFAAQPENEVVFGKVEGELQPFTSCGVLDEDLTTQPGYYVQGTSDYIPGAMTVGRKPNYEYDGDRPMPVGPGHLKVRYAFAAVAAYEGQELADPVLPDCSQPNPPVAAFEVTDPVKGRKEGRSIGFRDRSTDADNDIVKTTWDFGDGTTGSGTTPFHIYEDDGTYSVEVTVTDAKGNSDTSEQEIVVANEAPEAEIEDATAALGELKVRYRILDPGTADKKHLNWTLSSTNPAFPSESGTDHAGVWWRGPYTDLPAGTYPVTLTVTDDDGETARDEAVMVVIDGTPPPPPAPITTTYATCDPTVKLDREERDFLDLVNEYREDNGLPAVEVSATLTKAAVRHADDMAQHDYMAHTGHDGSSPGERAWESLYPKKFGVGENLAETETASESLWAWRGSSSGHNENMLEPSWRAIGIARAKSSASGKWRWATSYGTGVDCPTSTAPEARTTASSATRTPAGGPAPYEADAAPAVETAAAEPVAELPQTKEVSTFLRTEAVRAASSDPLYTPTVAFALKEDAARAGRAFEVVNRTRDSNGTPIAATLDFGDQTTPVVTAAETAAKHTYASDSTWDDFELKATATDSAGHTGTAKRWVDIWPDSPPDIYVVSYQSVAVADKPYEIKVNVSDPRTYSPIEGLEVTFKAGANGATATTDALGMATGKVKLLATAGDQKIDITTPESETWKAGEDAMFVNALVNHAPTAKAGGPYIVGEGRSLLLNGSRSSDPDLYSQLADKVDKWEWDLDDDGVFDDASGRLPAPFEADAIDTAICGGSCVAGTEYPIALRVTDKWGDTDVEETTVKLTADFDVLLGGESKTIVPGESNNFAVTVIGSESYSKTVTLEAFDLPAGVTATWSKNPVTPTDVSVLKLTGAANLQQGTFPVKVRATDTDGLVKTVTDEVKIAFGLIPICKGSVTGRITDQTGAPVAGASASISYGGSDTTDATGRFLIDEVALDFNNLPLQHTVSITKTGFWSKSATFTATCGGLPETDMQLLDVRTGTVKGKVIDKTTKAPIDKATITEYICDPPYTSCGSKVTATTGADGLFTRTPNLGTNNTETSWGGRAEAAGYWYLDAYTTIAENKESPIQYELLKKCSGKLKDGLVLDYDTKAPIKGAGVAIYANSEYTPDMVVQSDENGHFDVGKTVELGYNNGTRQVRAYPTPPASSPAGSTGYNGYFTLSLCGQEASVTLYIKVPKPNYGTLEGKVVDETTNEPVPGVKVTVCNACPTGTTGQDGRYKIENIYIGDDAAVTRYVTASVTPSGYYGTTKDVTLKANQTVQATDMKILKKRYGALNVKVTDAVTGAPVPGATVSDGCYGGSVFCRTMDRNGEASKTGIELGNRNADLPLGLTAEATGYWLQSKTATLKADQTTSLEYQLQPECDPAKVTGTVVNANTGEPIEFATVSAGYGSSDQTDAAGVFTIENIKPDTGNNPRAVTLTASAGGFYSQSKQITIFCGAQITIDFGSRTTQSGTLVGTVTDETTGDPIAGAFVGTTFGKTATTDASGNYTFTNVPLGDLDAPRDWSIYVKPEGYKPKTKTATVVGNVQTRVDFAFSTANVAPAAQPKVVELTEDTPTDFGVTGTDADGDTLTYHVMKWPQHGTISGKLPNAKFYPDSNYSGTDTFEYVVNDGVAGSERATVELKVAPVNDGPNAVDDYYESLPNTELRIPVADLTANDAEVDDEPIVITSVTPNMAGATVSIVGDEVVFNPPKDLDSGIQYAMVQYTVTDSGGLTDWAWIYIRVKSGPVAPACVGKTYSVARDAVLSDSVACTDANGDTLTHTVVAQPAQGSVSMAADGSFTYTPPAGYVGTTTFTYKASDGALESGVTTATIKVLPPNAAPSCSTVQVQTAEDEAADVTFSCEDADGDPLTITPFAQPGHGSLAAIAGGKYRYTPAKDYHGTDSFTYRASDSLAQSPAASVQITVTPVNDLAACVEATGGTDEDTPVTLTPTCTDADGDALTLTVSTAPAHGSVEPVSGGGLEYTPAKDFNGDDAFAFRADDGTAKSAPADGKVTVKPVNDAPACPDATATGDEDGVIVVKPSCVDVDGDKLTLGVGGKPVHGAVTEKGDGTFEYTPEKDYNGTDEFGFTAADATTSSGPAVAKLTVKPVNDLPVCTDLRLRTDAGVTAEVAPSCADVESDALSYEIVQAPAKGTAGVAGGKLTFLAGKRQSGEDAFTYRAKDGGGGSAPAKVEVLIDAVDVPNEPPVAGPDTVATDEDVTLKIPASDLLAGDTDPDEDQLVVTAIDGAEHGTVGVERATAGLIDGTGPVDEEQPDGETRGAAAGGQPVTMVTFVPDPDYNGTAGFRYTVEDPSGATATGTVAVTVRSVNDVPVAGDDELTTSGITPAVVPVAKLLANDRDADGDALSITDVVDAQHGTARIANGNVAFVAAAGFDGIASFRYRVGDPAGGVAMATVRVMVGAVKGTEQLFGCADRPIVLEDVVPDGRKVRLMGIVHPKHAGAKIELKLMPGAKTVARPVVGADGRYAATVPMPKGKTGEKARYIAVLGSERSTELRLWRRMWMSRVQVKATSVIISGRVTTPLAKKPADRMIEVREQAVCETGNVVARVQPGKDGKFRVVIKRRPDQLGAVYRLFSRVPANKRSSKLFPTFTLPRAVDF